MLRYPVSVCPTHQLRLLHVLHVTASTTQGAISVSAALQVPSAVALTSGQQGRIPSKYILPAYRMHGTSFRGEKRSSREATRRCGSHMQSSLPAKYLHTMTACHTDFAQRIDSLGTTQNGSHWLVKLQYPCCCPSLSESLSAYVHRLGTNDEGVYTYSGPS